MKGSKKRLAVLLTLAVLAVGIGWLLATYHVVDFKLYRKDTSSLDLRGQEISVSHYEKLSEKLPDIDIRWDVPFQGGLLPDDSREVTVTELSAEDARILAEHLPGLRAVNGLECADYENLLWLKQRRPEVKVEYRVCLNGTNYSGTAMQITLGGITEEELALLGYLPKLNTVTVTGGEAETLKRLRDYCGEKEIAFRLQLGGEVVSENAVIAAVDGTTNEELNLLQLMPKLKQLHLTEPEADAEKLLQLEKNIPGVTVTWEKTVLGKTFSNDATEIDLTDIIALGEGQKLGDKTAYQYGLDYPVQGTQEEVATAVKVTKYHPLPDKTDETKALIEQIEAAMEYFPNAEKLVMLGSTMHNEAMADFRERHREEYKVVWTVQCGYVATRSDAEFFMPVKYHVYYLNDAEAYNLRYCEDIVALDIGHMAVSDISFVEFMPKLEYLILAHTGIRYIEPIRSCKNLKFLEVDWTGIQDLSPLLDCTGLEDLNVGNTGVDLSPLKEMTWLKNLWMIFRGGAYELSQVLPDTKVVASGEATVDSGWRDLPNYFAMRDCLKMYYMSW